MISDKKDIPFRLNRFIAMCGIGSRRSVESFIRSGRVKVNGCIVRDLSYKVVPQSDEVLVDGIHIAMKPKSYLIMNKPKGMVCAVSDKFSKTVMDLLPPEIYDMGVFPVGRLDKDSEGLLILTNDGDMFQRIAHPCNCIFKTYEVLVDRTVSVEDLQYLIKGISVGSRVIRPIDAKVIEKQPRGRWLSITIAEGLKREIRIMVKSRGFCVIRLVRTRIGSLDLKYLPSGQFIKIEGDKLLKMIFSGGSV